MACNHSQDPGQNKTRVDYLDGDCEADVSTQQTTVAVDVGWWCRRPAEQAAAFAAVSARASALEACGCVVWCRG